MASPNGEVSPSQDHEAFRTRVNDFVNWAILDSKSAPPEQLDHIQKSLVHWMVSCFISDYSQPRW